MELVRAIRDEAGMATVLGDRTTAVFAGLDGIQAQYAQGLLVDLASAVESGEPPAGSAGLAGLTASVDGGPVSEAGPPAIDTSLFADTGFTASATLTLLTGLVRSAAEDGEWTLPREERVDQTIDGLRHQVELRTTVATTTGGGRVTVDVTL